MWKNIIIYLVFNNLQFLVAYGFSDNNKCENEILEKCNKLFYGNHTKNETDLGIVRALNGNQTELRDSDAFNENEDFLAANNLEDELLKTLSKKLTSLIKPFDASRNSKTSTACQMQSKVFLNALANLELWALKMYDASAKIPSGLLSGNINQYGDFDECLNTISPSQENLQGKYCLSYIQIAVPSDSLPRLKHIRKLMQSYDAFVNDFNDPGHRIPRFSIINWGLCVPSACSHIDVENSLNDYLREFTNGTSIEYQLRVEEKMCQTKKTEPYDRDTRLAISFFMIIIGITLLSTIIELTRDEPHDLLVAFSLVKNVKSMVSLKRSPTDIGPIHGIRFINAILLLVSHKSMALFFNPHTNRTGMVQSLGDYISIVGRAAALYTDVFLLLSGLLTSYSIIGRLQQNQPTRLLQEYVSRLFRIVPTLGALILFCTYCLPVMGSGPQWNLVVNQHADICKESWWRNLLFIHNYFGFGKMCLTHTHHLGIDTELFAVAPIFILTLWKWPKAGTIFLLTLAGLSTIGRFYITISQQLSNYVYFGASIQQLFRTADYMYSIPVHRATIYILGILMGYVLRRFKHIKLNNIHMVYGWTISIILLVSILLGPAPMGNMDYKYNAYHAAFYAALGPMAWCCLFAWIIFITQLGYTNFITEALSFKGFLITTRLSYAVYLTQFPIFFYNVGTTRHSGYYQFPSSLINLYEYICVFIVSAILTLLFETPFQNIKTFIFKAKRSKTNCQPSMECNSTSLNNNVEKKMN